MKPDRKLAREFGVYLDETVKWIKESEGKNYLLLKMQKFPVEENKDVRKYITRKHYFLDNRKDNFKPKRTICIELTFTEEIHH